MCIIDALIIQTPIAAQSSTFRVELLALNLLLYTQQVSSRSNNIQYATHFILKTEPGLR